MNKMICAVFRSTKKEGAYLYLNKAKGLECLPDALTALFGKPQEAFTMLLTPEKKLAHADVHKVLAELSDKGYYLQLPPPQPDYMQEINKHNNKLPR